MLLYLECGSHIGRGIRRARFNWWGAAGLVGPAIRRLGLAGRTVYLMLWLFKTAGTRTGKPPCRLYCGGC